MDELDELRRSRPDVSPPAVRVRRAAAVDLASAVASERAHGVRTSDRSGSRASRAELSHSGRGHTTSVGRPLLAAVACVLAAVALALLLLQVVPGSRPRSTTPHGDLTPRPSSHGEASIVLAGDRFALPAGFKRVAQACQAALVPSGSGPVTVLGGMEAAASAAGGCVEAELDAGDAVVPSDAEPVGVGSYHGFLEALGPTSEVLYVAIPAVAGDHYLVVSATGLSPSELIAIIAGGLPSDPGAPVTCTAGCG